jgi:hypothetical protein
MMSRHVFIEARKEPNVRDILPPIIRYGFDWSENHWPVRETFFGVMRGGLSPRYTKTESGLCESS